MRWNAVAVALVALWGMEPAWPRAQTNSSTSAQEETQSGTGVSAPQPDRTSVPTDTELGLPTDANAPEEAPAVSAQHERTSMIRSDRPVLELSLAEAIQLTLSKSIPTRIRGVERDQAIARVEGS